METERTPLPPEDTAASSLTFSNWFTTELSEEARQEFLELDRARADHDAERNAAEGKQRATCAPWLLDPAAGDFGSRNACWVCYSALTYANSRLPRFRACFYCLTYDRHQASKLGLRMLLPLMDWHAQPVLSGGKAPADPTFRGWLADVWSQVSALKQWRIDGVRSGIALLGLGDQPTVEDWVAAMRPGPHRSRACWEAFMAGYHPRLYGVLTRIDRMNEERSQTPATASPA